MLHFVNVTKSTTDPGKEMAGKLVAEARVAGFSKSPARGAYKS